MDSCMKSLPPLLPFPPCIWGVRNFGGGGSGEREWVGLNRWEPMFEVVELKVKLSICHSWGEAQSTFQRGMSGWKVMNAVGSGEQVEERVSAPGMVNAMVREL